MHIGPESFRFSRPENEQNFGDICSISPVFLIDQNNHYYVKTPFNDASWADQKNRETFRPMRLVPEEQAVMTQWGKIRMPQEGEFAYKQWHASDYFNLQERKAVSSCIKENQQLFRSVMITGNRKAEQTPEEDGFFKREGKILHGDFSFAVFIEVKSDTFPDPVRTLCRMGQKQSLFQVTLEEKKDDLEERVRDAFSKETEEPWYYALSDIVLTEEVRYREFCIVEMKSVRNLETSYNQKSTYIKKMRKNRVQYNLIESGSVFYGEFPVAVSEETAPGGNSSGGDGATESGEERLRTLQDLISPNHKKIGYSHIVKIEANHK